MGKNLVKAAVLLKNEADGIRVVDAGLSVTGTQLCVFVGRSGTVSFKKVVFLESVIAMANGRWSPGNGETIELEEFPQEMVDQIKKINQVEQGIYEFP